LLTSPRCDNAPIRSSLLFPGARRRSFSLGSPFIIFLLKLIFSPFNHPKGLSLSHLDLCRARYFFFPPFRPCCRFGPGGRFFSSNLSKLFLVSSPSFFFNFLPPSQRRQPPPLFRFFSSPGSTSTPRVFVDLRTSEGRSFSFPVPKCPSAPPPLVPIPRVGYLPSGDSSSANVPIRSSLRNPFLFQPRCKPGERSSERLRASTSPGVGHLYRRDLALFLKLGDIRRLKPASFYLRAGAVLPF